MCPLKLQSRLRSLEKPPRFGIAHDPLTSLLLPSRTGTYFAPEIDKCRAPDKSNGWHALRPPHVQSRESYGGDESRCNMFERNVRSISTDMVAAQMRFADALLNMRLRVPGPPELQTRRSELPQNGNSLSARSSGPVCRVQTTTVSSLLSKCRVSMYSISYPLRSRRRTSCLRRLGVVRRVFMCRTPVLWVSPIADKRRE